MAASCDAVGALSLTVTFLVAMLPSPKLLRAPEALDEPVPPRARLNMPLVIRLAGSTGMRAKPSIPLVILLALNVRDTGQLPARPAR